MTRLIDDDTVISYKGYGNEGFSYSLPILKFLA